jgi:hypothetical protein
MFAGHGRAFHTTNCRKQPAPTAAIPDPKARLPPRWPQRRRQPEKERREPRLRPRGLFSALTKQMPHNTVCRYMGGHMEKLLVRLAQQLDAIDEASLMSLWSKYATAASRFEPTKRWEEATLIFSLIQAKRWKNQLFNYYWSRQAQPAGSQKEEGLNPMPDFELERPEDSPAPSHCRVLEFKPSKGDAREPEEPEADK